jgi:hypothetical protein
MSAMQIGEPCLDGCLASPGTMAVQARDVLAGVSYDTMAGTGMSGALVIPMLARELDSRWLILRKPGDSHHHGSSPGQGSLGNRWLFVDDGIKTGATVRRVYDQVTRIAAQRGHPTEFAGAYLYGDHDHFGRPAGYYSPRELAELLERLARWS